MELTDRSYGLSDDQQRGFDLSLLRRNELLSAAVGAGAEAPKTAFWKTGTTICGCICRDVVVLGADTRATGDSEVVDKNCDKIHYLAPNIWCCGAGTAADTEKATELIASNLELLRLSTGTKSRVVTALTMMKRMLFRYQGNVSAALVLGGVDVHGPHLFTIFPHGSTSRLPYATMGSGSLAAMAVFETRFKEGMSEEEGVLLVRDAIRAGIMNDLGSGSRVDVTVVRRDDVTRTRCFENAAGDASDYKIKYARPARMNPPAGATVVIEESFKPHKAGRAAAGLESSVESMEIA